MNVAFVTASLSREAGGLFTSVRRLGQSLRASAGTDALELTVLGVRDRHTEEDAPLWAPLPTSISSPLPPRSLALAPGLLRQLMKLRPDLVHCHGIWQYPSHVINRWAATTGRPHLVSPRGMLDSWALNHGRWKKRLAGLLYENRHLRGAACLHALCETERRALRAHGLSNPVCVIPNGIDIPTGRPLSPWPLATALPALHDHKALLFLGRIHPKKGLPMLLNAWKQVTADSRPAADDWILLIAGWDQAGHEALLRRESAALGLSERVHFAGPLHGDDKDAAFRHSAAFVLPSLSEGLPMAVLEAWAHSLPTLITTACNLPEGAAAGAAIEVDPDATSLAGGLRRLIGLSDGERLDMGARGLRLAAERFSWPVIARDMLDVYQWLLGGGEPPPSVIRS